MEWLKHALTGKDNQTIDLGRVLWLVGAVVFFGGVVVLIYRDKWDMMVYGGALAAVLVAGGAGLKIKETTEPGA